MADPLSQLGGALGQGFVEAVSPASRANRRILRRDIDALEKNELGYSQAQAAQIRGDAIADVQAQSDAARTALAQQQAAEGGLGRSGAAQAALGAITRGAQDAAGKINMGVQQQSDAVAAQRRQEILARIRDQAAKNSASGQQVGAAAGGLATTALTGKIPVTTGDTTVLLDAFGGRKK